MEESTKSAADEAEMTEGVHEHENGEPQASHEEGHEDVAVETENHRGEAAPVEDTEMSANAIVGSNGSLNINEGTRSNSGSVSASPITNTNTNTDNDAELDSTIPTTVEPSSMEGGGSANKESADSNGAGSNVVAVADHEEEDHHQVEQSQDESVSSHARASEDEDQDDDRSSISDGENNAKGTEGVQTADETQDSNTERDENRNENEGEGEAKDEVPDHADGPEESNLQKTSEVTSTSQDQTGAESKFDSNSSIPEQRNHDDLTNTERKIQDEPIAAEGVTSNDLDECNPQDPTKQQQQQQQMDAPSTPTQSVSSATSPSVSNAIQEKNQVDHSAGSSSLHSDEQPPQPNPPELTDSDQPSSPSPTTPTSKTAPAPATTAESASVAASVKETTSAPGPLAVVHCKDYKSIADQRKAELDALRQRHLTKPHAERLQQAEAPLEKEAFFNQQRSLSYQVQRKHLNSTMEEWHSFRANTDNDTVLAKTIEKEKSKYAPQHQSQRQRRVSADAHSSVHAAESSPNAASSEIDAFHSSQHRQRKMQDNERRKTFDSLHTYRGATSPTSKQMPSMISNSFINVRSQFYRTEMGSVDYAATTEFDHVDSSHAPPPSSSALSASQPNSPAAKSSSRAAVSTVETKGAVNDSQLVMAAEFGTALPPFQEVKDGLEERSQDDARTPLPTGDGNDAIDGIAGGVSSGDNLTAMKGQHPQASATFDTADPHATDEGEDEEQRVEDKHKHEGQLQKQGERSEQNQLTNETSNVLKMENHGHDVDAHAASASASVQAKNGHQRQVSGQSVSTGCRDGMVHTEFRHLIPQSKEVILESPLNARDEAHARSASLLSSEESIVCIREIFGVKDDENLGDDGRINNDSSNVSNASLLQSARREEGQQRIDQTNANRSASSPQRQAQQQQQRRRRRRRGQEQQQQPQQSWADRASSAIFGIGGMFVTRKYISR